jgi:tetratricopeptide (TPR) repeat protein
VWTPATTGLAQLFFADTTGKGDTALRTVLASDATITDRLGAKPNTAQQLTGELWFYYAVRDGQLRLLAPSTRDSAEDLLAADLEYSSNANSYATLAETYAEAGNAPAALAELDHVLELDPNAADTHDARAMILWNAGRRDEAVAAWRAGLASLRVIEDRAAAPESFWSGFARIARHLHEHGLSAQLKPQMDDVLRIYIARNGNYRSSELLRAAFASAASPAEGAEWVLSLASAAVDPLAVLQDLDSAAWLPPSAREVILLREIQLAQTAIKTPPDSYDVARTRMFSSQDALIALYVAQHEDTRALALLRSLDATQRSTPKMQQTEAVLSARTGQLDALLDNYRSQLESAPAASVLRDAAAELARGGLQQPARALLEFSFDRALTAHTLTSTDYLGLAEARLRTGDLDGALSLLNALAQTSGDTYANLDSAAALLEKTAHAADAIPFLTKLAGSTPWDLSYKVRLAEAQQHAKQSETDALTALAAVAHNSLAPYALRAGAARDLSGAPHTDLGSGELTLLASGTISPAAARQPFFVAARVAAATQSHEAKQQVALLREAIAIAPGTPSILLDLFRAEVRADNAAGLRAAMDALLKTPSSAEADFRIDEDPTIGGQNYAPLPTIAAPLPAAEHATLAAQFAEVYRNGGELPPALAYFKLALHLAPADARAPDIRAKIAAIEAEQRLEAANAMRRPVIHKTLDQAVVVRSRLSTAPEDTPLPKEEE